MSGLQIKKYTKFWPYRIMCILLYGTSPNVTYAGSQVNIALGPFATELGMAYVKLRHYLEECEALGMVTDMKFHKNLCTARILPPRIGVLPPLGDVVASIVNYLLEADDQYSEVHFEEMLSILSKLKYGHNQINKNEH
jgi:hypothetical protein